MSISRYFHLSDGQWCDVTFTTDGHFTVPIGMHELEIGESYGKPVTGVDSPKDPRVKPLAEQPPAPAPIDPPTLADAVYELINTTDPKGVRAG